MNMKFEFTGETKVLDGVTLKRIRAVTAIAAIDLAAGDLGGWIEKEKNLSVSGNAWVSGNARVYGDARVSGDAQVSGNALVSASIIAATRTDGYTFVVVQTEKDKIPRIIAGCRYFTFEQARDHWKARPGKKSIREESMALVDHLERMAKIQGWLK